MSHTISFFSEKDGQSRIPRHPKFRSRYSDNVLKLLQIQPTRSRGRCHGKKTPGATLDSEPLCLIRCFRSQQSYVSMSCRMCLRWNSPRCPMNPQSRPRPVRCQPQHWWARAPAAARVAPTLPAPALTRRRNGPLGWLRQEQVSDKQVGVTTWGPRSKPRVEGQAEAISTPRHIHHLLVSESFGLFCFSLMFLNFPKKMLL